ncbi:MAG TPA: J domain-containing protein [Thermomicrobiales bacterium]|jgi:hypothetical protein|nr:J domain-containing protein [Thermomicrobiales bacterium]
MTADTSGLRAVPSPDELAYQRLLVVIEATRQQAVELRADLEQLRDDLGRFEATYHARVGHLLVDLNRLQLECDEYRQRIAIRQASWRTDDATIESDIERMFRGRRQDVEDERAEADAWQRLADSQPDERLDAASADELRRVYRELARRHHPDLAQDPAERERRERQMTRVNAAYRDRDLGALQEMMTLAPEPGETQADRTPAERLAWATGELRRLDDVVAKARADLGLARSSATHALWLRARSDAGLLDDIAREIQSRIDEARAVLDDLRRQSAAASTKDE